MEQNDLKETISATSSHLSFFYSNYYERTSEPPKDSSHKCVNNYSPFSLSSSLISPSTSLESSPRISFGSIFSQNLWQLLHDRFEQLHDLHPHTVSSSSGTMSSSVAMLIKPSFEGFQPCSCVSTWCVVLKKCPFCGKKFSHFDIFRFSIFTFLSRDLLHFWKYEPPSFCKVSNLRRFGNMRRDNKSLDCFKIFTEKFFKNLQNAFKILLPAWRKCFFPCFFWFACEFVDPIKPISVWKPAKAFFSS